MNQSGDDPNRLGMDARWWEERGHWSAAQVAAPCEQVAKAFSQISDIEPIVYSAFAPNRTFAAEWERVIFVYQLRQYEWTLLESIGNRITWDVAELLSAALSTRSLVHAYENTGGVYGYQLCAGGDVTEEFSWGDTPEFDNSNRSERMVDGWMLSDDNYRQLRSKRLHDIDMNAQDILDLPNRTAADLRLYIPCDVWDVDSESGEVALCAPWSKQDIVDAKIVLSTW